MTTTPPEGFVFYALLLACLALIATLGARLNGIAGRMAVLGRVEAKLDLLLKQANIKYDPYAYVAADVAEALRSNQKIKAIKLYREASGVGLKEAKDYVEGVQRRAGVG